ncbi:hypothetical protein [Marivirga harenae]|uniref:hypothetical protein n=1 Tax=Marivirga harenae TaxID=2010992 RepID=UPI0026DEA449|nr:hypothetical protein [Marivirga harenae]WKV12566.1 hypothetical protein Q3Y49_01795 [Marivirga harenae]|tara:strand:+ start:2960 stop:3934 length:975 start_codon:yes stop_codon:yes gene_type:complete
MNKNILVLLFVMFIYVPSCFGQNQTLRDSLLMFHTEEELEEMSLTEIQNVIRKIRGQELIPEKIKDSLDFYGIYKLNKNSIDTAQKKQNIDKYITRLSRDTSNLKKRIIPNSFVDIYNRFLSGFYLDIRERDLRHNNYKNYTTKSGSEYSFDINDFNNHAKRTYYYDEEDIVLVEIETRNGIFKKEESLYLRQVPPYRTELNYFAFNNGELVFYKKILKGEVYTGYGKSYEEIANSTTTPVEIEIRYFYKSNNFLTFTGGAELTKNNWKNLIANIELEEIIHRSNEFVIIARNYLAELNGFDKKENDYLNSTLNSVVTYEDVND